MSGSGTQKNVCCGRGLVACCAFEAEVVVFGACGAVLVLLSVLYMTASVFCLIAAWFGYCLAFSRASFILGVLRVLVWGFPVCQ